MKAQRAPRSRPAPEPEAPAAELMVPAEVRVVRAVPLLGSGKTDFAAVRRMAEAADAAVEHAV